MNFNVWNSAGWNPDPQGHYRPPAPAGPIIANRPGQMIANAYHLNTAPGDALVPGTVYVLTLGNISNTNTGSGMTYQGLVGGQHAFI